MWGFGGTCLVATAILLTPTAAGAQTIPPFTAPVVDAANVVPDDMQANLDRALNAYQQQTGNQIAVAVINTTGGRSIEEYALDLANQWGVGTALLDNGVVLVIAYDDRTLRIEVGQGLEARLTDASAAYVIDAVIVPLLRQGNIGTAVEQGIAGIIAAIETGPITTDARTLSADTPPVAYEAPDFDDENEVVSDFAGGVAMIFVIVVIGFGVIGAGILKGGSWKTPMSFGSGSNDWWNNNRHDSGFGGSSRRDFGGGSSSSSGGGGFSGGGGGSFGGGGASGKW